MFLENVDRLLKSPATQRGRDFAIILASLSDLGYAVEWRVINAAEYGLAQRRRRVFIFAFRKDTSFYNKLLKFSNYRSFLLEESFFAIPFKLDKNYHSKYKVTDTSIHKSKYSELTDISKEFHANLYNTGLMIDSKIYSEQTQPVFVEPITLRAIIHKTEVDKSYFLKGSLDKWQYLKGSKRINRIRPNGKPYIFSEGNLVLPFQFSMNF